MTREEDIAATKPAYEKDVRFIGTDGSPYGIPLKGSLPQFGIDGVSGTVVITGSVAISDAVSITGSVVVTGSVEISGQAEVTGSVTVDGEVSITGSVVVTGSVAIASPVEITGSVIVTGSVEISNTVPISVARTESNPVIITQAVAEPGTGEALAGSSTPATQLVLEARRVSGANTDTVYIGTSTVDKTSSQQITLEPGDNFVFAATDGQSLDLDALYVDAVTGSDGVTGWYIGA